MADPVLHLIVGANGSGESTFFTRELAPLTHLVFVNADVIARERWPDDAESRSYEVAALAAEERAGLIAERRSFATETVFSHSSKLDLIAQAKEAGYLVILHVLVIPEALTVLRVVLRVQQGGHSVPEVKIRERYTRLWAYVAAAIEMVDEAVVYDNSKAAEPFRIVARYRGGRRVMSTPWPAWTPQELSDAGTEGKSVERGR